jgi:hypothetical protein
MKPLRMALILGAFICFALEAFEIRFHKVNLIGAGLGLWAASTLIP